MTRFGMILGAAMLGLALAGCQHQGTDAQNDSANSSAPAGLVKPAANADENTWGNYLAEQGKLHGKDVAQRPYIYVIPAGDSTGAVDRRKSEVDSISHGIVVLVVSDSTEQSAVNDALKPSGATVRLVTM